MGRGASAARGAIGAAAEPRELGQVQASSAIVPSCPPTTACASLSTATPFLARSGASRLRRLIASGSCGTEMAREVIESLRSQFSRCDANLLIYCLMPDHLHAGIAIGQIDLITILRGFKSFPTILWRQRSGEKRERTGQPCANVRARHRPSPNPLHYGCRLKPTIPDGPNPQSRRDIHR